MILLLVVWLCSCLFTYLCFWVVMLLSVTDLGFWVVSFFWAFVILFLGLLFFGCFEQYVCGWFAVKTLWDVACGLFSYSGFALGFAVNELFCGFV